jgi:hypothetical protein
MRWVRFLHAACSNQSFLPIYRPSKGVELLLGYFDLPIFVPASYLKLFFVGGFYISTSIVPLRGFVLLPTV